MQDVWLTDVYKSYRRWKQWDQAAQSPHEASLFAVELRRAGVTPPGAVLEIGFGDGRFLRYAQSRGYRCSGVEISDEAVATLKEAGIDARVGTLAAFAESSFDLVAAFDVFEHMTPTELLETLRQAHRVLRPGGRLLARFPNAASPFGAVNQFGDITHLTALSAQSFGQLGEVAGFRLLLAANAAWTWRGNGLAKSILKPVSIVLRRVVELVLGVAYYGKLMPLDPETTVVLEARSVERVGD
jgi:SAM-dependent methyltransferase